MGYRPKGEKIFMIETNDPFLIPPGEKEKEKKQQLSKININICGERRFPSCLSKGEEGVLLPVGLAVLLFLPFFFERERFSRLGENNLTEKVFRDAFVHKKKPEGKFRT